MKNYAVFQLVAIDVLMATYHVSACNLSGSTYFKLKYYVGGIWDTFRFVMLSLRS
jgi:hypothetical protein